jgi:hypothetical protein
MTAVGWFGATAGALSASKGTSMRSTMVGIGGVKGR